MKSHNATNGSAVDHLPEALQELLSASVPIKSVWAAASFDLDSNGRYVDGYLVLTDGRLGQFIQSDGQWDVRWLDLSDYTEAKIVDGLGMSLLRLLADGKRMEEFRFTMRHARQLARLYRQLARQIEGKGKDLEPIEERAQPDEKKLRCEKCGRVIPAWAEYCPACMSRRKILFRLLDFVWPYWARVITGILIALAILGFGLLQPGLRKPMIDRGLGALPDTSPDWPLFLKLLGLWAGLVLLTFIGQGVQMRVMAGLGARVARDLRSAVYGHLHKLSLSFFGRKRTGSLVTRTTSDTDRLWDFIAFTVVDVVMAILTIVGVSAVMLAMHWKLALFTLMPIPIMLSLMAVFHKRLHRVFGRIFHRWSQMTSVVASALPGVRVIKAFGQEGREVDRFQGKSNQVYNEEISMINIWTVFGPAMRLCAFSGMLIIWLLGGWWIVRDYGAQNASMTVGTLMAFIGYMMMFYRPIHMIAHMDQRFNRAATSAQRIFEVLDTEPAIFSQPNAKKPKQIRGEIELRNVSFSYDGIRKVLKNVNLKIAPGEMVGLAGPSGGGKTTMINLICRFYDVIEGTILIDGIDVRDYKVELLRKRIGVVLQDPFLFHGTVAENIAYGNPQATLDEIIASARAANAHDFITGFPDGYDTIVGERGHSLSGGERQRISIARAILDNPSVLILDEATSSVDTETEQLIQEALERLIANRTTIAIAHRLSTLRKANRLVILDKGELVEEGSHEELANKEGGLYARLLRMQAQLQTVVGTTGPGRPGSRRNGAGRMS